MSSETQSLPNKEPLCSIKTNSRTTISSAPSSKKTSKAANTKPSKPASRPNPTATCIGHAKSICLNFGLAYIYDGLCNLRFDDTNPEKENDEYVNAIKEDVEWLGFHWAGEPRFASNYFDQLYDYAVGLIKDGKAYVDDLTPEEMREYRGTLTEAGKNSPYRDRSIEENLDLFTRMKNGEFPDGSKTLRLKIDMASGNINMRDPVIYRIRRAHHHNTGDKWCIYPMYDYTHCISDAIEGITHSLCTLEFEAHRPLYDWVLDNIPAPHATRPRQYEFSRLELLYSITSKRKLNQLVSEGHVSGWDDPRMPTISGMRRRGYTPEGLRLFAKRAGISKSENIVDMSVLEGAIREELENSAPRMMAVLNPLKVTLTNFQTVLAESRTAPYHPNREDMGSRELPISSTLYIEADDFSENPPKGFKRLTLGGEVRLRHSYVMKCDEVVKDAAGNIVELKCSLDYDTLGKNPEGRKVKALSTGSLPNTPCPPPCACTTACSPNPVPMPCAAKTANTCRSPISSTPNRSKKSPPTSKPPPTICLRRAVGSLNGWAISSPTAKITRKAGPYSTARSR